MADRKINLAGGKIIWSGQVGKLFWQGRWENYLAGGKIILAGGKIILEGLVNPTIPSSPSAQIPE